MTEPLAEEFERRRPHLRRVAYRLLGSPEDAEDAVQEAWVRLQRSDTSDVVNLDGWLTTVVARISLDMLRSRSSRREQLNDQPGEPEGYASTLAPATAPNPADQAELADTVGLALFVVLDRLSPSERIAFVLHDLFAVSFDEIAPVIGTTSAAARQLASRARRRLRGAEESEGDVAAQRAVVDAFLAAARGGDLTTLLRLLAPDVVLDVDAAAAQTGALRLVGADDVAGQFAGRARVAQTALVDGAVGAVWSVGGRPRIVFDFVVRGGRVAAITLLADPDTLEGMDLELLDRP
ncbi:MAG TPA: sigma-70 family RNA polymerase sigma factor [Lapillicoccus sp.]|nr:sigma-70 family RNA polymerase sigma factor [Lapillicoccus sp.]